MTPNLVLRLAAHLIYQEGGGKAARGHLGIDELGSLLFYTVVPSAAVALGVVYWGGGPDAYRAFSNARWTLTGLCVVLGGAWFLFFRSYAKRHREELEVEVDRIAGLAKGARSAERRRVLLLSTAFCLGPGFLGALAIVLKQL